MNKTIISNCDNLASAYKCFSLLQKYIGGIKQRSEFVSTIVVDADGFLTLSLDPVKKDSCTHTQIKIYFDGEEDEVIIASTNLLTMVVHTFVTSPADSDSELKIHQHLDSMFDCAA